tara:strand:+ start:897 stop:2303 length:1407 start_codon:yes stop_codon:yes gene_type:complete
MTSTIKVNTITTESGSTLTVGGCGKTVALASGASQTGFGRTGTVDWQTTKITADPGPAVSGKGYFTDTSSAAFNVTLPSSPSAGDIIAVKDYANSWDDNALTIVRNGSNIEGDAENLICNIEGSSITLVYVDATKGWVTVNSGNTDQAVASLFICATGGTVTTSGDCKIHTFTGPGIFTVNAIASVCGSTRNNVSYLVVGGGGAGGQTNIGGGGGGAGGFREFKAPLTPYTASPLDGNPCGTSITVTATNFPIAVGAGGASGGPGPGPGPASKGNPGAVSTFSTVTAAAGGGGAGDTTPSPAEADDGGSGGGGYGASTLGPAGTGNTPPVTPPQGNNGGPAGSNPSNYANAGGGGGATATGEPITGNFPGGGPGGNGGAGATTSITGSPVGYAGGGGGAADNRAASRTGGDAGTGGGGQGGDPTRATTSGTANTGGGGGGQHGPSNPSNVGFSGAGGSGIVVIRYKFQ